MNEETYNAKFTWHDYSFFAVMLTTGALIGIYFGFYKKQETMKDYLFGGKDMGATPISMSMVTNAVSGITLLSIPADVYMYGASYWLAFADIILVILITYKVFLPVFYKLQITSTFQYLKLRFDTKTRLLGSFLFGILTLLYLPIVIYVPSLALAQATGLHLHLITCLFCLICIFYTSVGGLKAAVYSDTLQYVLVISSLIMVFAIGVINVGGFQHIWNIAYENGRLTIPLNIDFTKRETIWSGTFGMIVMWTSSLGINQVFIQKSLALPTKEDVKKAFILYGAGFFIIGTLCVANGLIVYTHFYDCDPIQSGILEKYDQLMPFYILNVLKVPGLPGLFIAGTFSASLSTFSGGMNALSSTIYEDFVAPKISKTTSEVTKSKILKLIAASIGVISTVLVTVVERLGGMLALSNSLMGVTSGPIIGLFSMGMLVPMVNEKGAYYGGLTALSIMAFIVGGHELHQSYGSFLYPTLPLAMNGCDNHTLLLNNINQTFLSTGVNEDVFVLFRISFYWYTLIGMMIFIVCSVIISVFTKTDKIVSKDLLSPVIHRFLSENYMTSPPTYSSIDKALTVIENR